MANSATEGTVRQEIHHLVETVRKLEIEPTGQPSPRCIRIGISKEALPDQLLAVREALDAVDASGVLVVGGDPNDEMAKLRAAVDGLLRFVKMRGIGAEDAEDIVRSALGKSKRRHKRLEPLPVFAPNGWKYRKKIKPKLGVARGQASKGKIESDARKMNWVITSLGPAAVSLPNPANREPSPGASPAE